MPHKRAKRSIREQDRSQKGTDLAPNRSKDALSAEPLPKSFARAINAAQVRADFRAKRKLGEGEGEDGPKRRSGGRLRRVVYVTMGAEVTRSSFVPVCQGLQSAALA
ncbi:hypothetical protein B0H13DRAFT_1878755 [Mycena leptocephala]|nr:hypothetical protein B0H13DRAFT_1878755 [Mycena leptocephala]